MISSSFLTVDAGGTVIRIRYSIVRPENDLAAKTLGSWREFLDWDPGARQLVGHAVNRTSVEEFMRTSNMIVYFGHGLHDCLTGATRLVDADNIGNANGIIIAALACQSAATLGDLALTAGARAYLGFADDLIWADSFSDEFGRAATSGVTAMLRGRPLGEAVEVIRSEFGSLVNRFRNLRHPDRAWAFLSANWNKDYVCGKGSLDTRLHR